MPREGPVELPPGIGPVELNRRFPDGDPRRDPGQRPSARGAPGETDRIELTADGLVALALLRERVLDATRRALEVGPGEPVPHFAIEPQAPIRDWVGRLLSDQNLLAARRRAAWPAARVDRALEQGLRDGIADALDILHALDRLDPRAWESVTAVLAELERKLGAAINPR
jgi:hypothetical protein